MASFESKVSNIFAENPKLARKMPVVIKRIFRESQSEFKRRMENETEDVRHSSYLRLFDTLFIDFYFDELNDRFMNWVIERYPERFTEAELEEMSAQADSHLDFYEVQEVIPGKGSYIKSLITGEGGFLKDVSSSTNLVKWDIFLARCYRFRGDYYATGTVALFRPQNKKFILKRIEEAMSNFGEVEFAEFAKDHWDIFFQIERDIREQELNKKIYTKYGELQLCEARFRVNDLKAILNEIKRRKEFIFVETKTRRDKKKKRNIIRYQFEWITQGIEEELESIKIEDVEDGIMLTTSRFDEKGKQMDIEFLGNLYVDQSLCRLEISSLEIAEFAVRYLTSIFGDALTFKRIVKTKLDLKPEHDIGGESNKPAQPVQSHPELIKEIGEKYYLSLLDEKIPALKNMTPREARQDPAVLPLLIEWLKGLENMSERQRLEGEETVSISKIKKELDIDY